MIDPSWNTVSTQICQARKGEIIELLNCKMGAIISMIRLMRVFGLSFCIMYTHSQVIEFYFCHFILFLKITLGTGLIIPPWHFNVLPNWTHYSWEMRCVHLCTHLFWRPKKIHVCQSRNKSQAAEKCPAGQNIRQWAGNKGHHNGNLSSLN